MSNDKSVYVVLSKSSTVISKVISGVKGDRYTHASLALDKNLTHMFSFSRRWALNPFIGCFKKESMNEGLYKYMDSLPGVILEIPITSQQYDSVCRLIEKIRLAADAYGYNYFGLIGNLFGFSFRDNKRFFCSEFVYYILYESGICDLGIPCGAVRPQTLLSLESRVVFSGDIKKYVERRDFAEEIIGAGSNIFSKA